METKKDENPIEVWARRLGYKPSSAEQASILFERIYANPKIRYCMNRVMENVHSKSKADSIRKRYLYTVLKRGTFNFKHPVRFIVKSEKDCINYSKYVRVSNSIACLNQVILKDDLSDVVKLRSSLEADDRPRLLTDFSFYTSFNTISSHTNAELVKLSDSIVTNRRAVSRIFKRPYQLDLCCSLSKTFDGVNHDAINKQSLLAKSPADVIKLVSQRQSSDLEDLSKLNEFLSNFGKEDLEPIFKYLFDALVNNVEYFETQPAECNGHNVTDTIMCNADVDGCHDSEQEFETLTQTIVDLRNKLNVEIEKINSLLKFKHDNYFVSLQNITKSHVADVLTLGKQLDVEIQLLSDRVKKCVDNVRASMNETSTSNESDEHLTNIEKIFTSWGISTSSSDVVSTLSRKRERLEKITLILSSENRVEMPSNSSIRSVPPSIVGNNSAELNELARQVEEAVQLKEMTTDVRSTIINHLRNVEYGTVNGESFVKLRSQLREAVKKYHLFYNLISLGVNAELNKGVE